MSPNRTEVVLAAVALERIRQAELLDEGSIPEDLSDVTIDDATKVSILLEELGEVAKEINEQHLNGIPLYLDNLYTELVQLGACAVAWAEGVSQMKEFVNGWADPQPTQGS